MKDSDGSSLIRQNRHIVQRLLPPWNVYQQTVPLKQYSLEHIIPQRLFLEPTHAYDLDNLVSCELEWNSIRSDYRYGLGKTTRKKQYSFGQIFPQERIFLPCEQADYGLLSRSILNMLHRYPYLYRVLDQIIDPPYLLDVWSQYPCLSFEQLRSRFKKVSE